MSWKRRSRNCAGANTTRGLDGDALGRTGMVESGGVAHGGVSYPMARSAWAPIFSHIEPEIKNIAVLDDVVAPLGAHLAGVLGALLAVAGGEIPPRDGLGADEAALEVGVDGGGGLDCRAAALDRPGTRLLRPGGKNVMRSSNA